MHLTIDYATLKELGQKLENKTLNRDAFIKLIEAAKELGLELQSKDYNDLLQEYFIPHKNGHLEIFKLLLSFGGADVNSKFGGFYLLQKAVAMKREEIVKTLLSHPDIDVNAVDGYGQTPLHGEARNLKIMKLLLDHPEIDIEHRAHDGRTPLFFSVNVRWTMVLLSCGANPNAVDDHGGTPLTDACRYHEFGKVRVLLENGADPLIGKPGALERCDDNHDEDSVLAVCGCYEEDERSKAERALVQEYIDLGASGKGKKRRKLK